MTPKPPPSHAVKTPTETRLRIGNGRELPPTPVSAKAPSPLWSSRDWSRLATIRRPRRVGGAPTRSHSYAPGMTKLIDAADRRIVSFLNRWSIPALRVSLGLVFLWFGALKIFGVTPVTDLVADTVYWVDPDWFVPLLGVAEVVVGVGLLTKIGLRAVLALFMAQMLGTFLVLVVQPDVAFQDGNLLELTVEGEFVVKNLVLLSAGMVVGTQVRRRG